MPRDPIPTLEQALHTLQAELPAWLQAERVAGLGLVLLDGENQPHPHYVGYAQIDPQQPLDGETVFEAASLTKPLVAYLALKLAEEGRFSLDLPLDGYLDEPYLPHDPRASRITARMVLRHTTGFPNWAEKGQPLRTHFQPGGHFSYSGEGFVFLQRMLAALNGASLAELLRDRLLGPLGMHSSSLVWQPAYESSLAAGFDAQGQPVERRPHREPNAAYSLYSTPADLARFLRVVVDPPPGSAAFLEPHTAAAMLSRQVSVNELAPWHPHWPLPLLAINPSVAWGLGWGLQEYQAERQFWHWGDNPGHQSLVIGAPARRAPAVRGLVAMATSENARRLWQPLARAVFGGRHPGLEWLARQYQQIPEPSQRQTARGDTDEH